MVLRWLLLSAVVALTVGSSTAHADDPYRIRGRAIVTVTPTDLDGARDPVRYEVDALFSAEASSHSNGLLCRFELTDVVERRRGVFVLDLDLAIMIDSRTIELPSRSVSLRYHELAPGALLAFDGQVVTGHVELVTLSYTSTPGVSVHLRFDAELADTLSGETRLFESGELVAIDSTLPPNADPWLYDEAPDVIILTEDYGLTDCSGDPYDDEPWDDEPWDDEPWDDGEGYDFGGNTVGGSGGDNTGGSSSGGYGSGDNTGGGYDYGDGQNVDTGSTWSDNDWSSDSYDSSGGCDGDSGDDGLDCGGDDVGGGEGCDGGSSGGDALDCVHATRHAGRSSRHGARWRGWNLFPLIPFLLWWGWLKRLTPPTGPNCGPTRPTRVRRSRPKSETPDR